MWILQLNDMRSSNVETMQFVTRAETREELDRFIASESVEPYRDGTWAKSFRDGGPLEWFNLPMPFVSAFIDLGTEDEYSDMFAERARENYRNIMAGIPLLNVSSAPSC